MAAGMQGWLDLIPLLLPAVTRIVEPEIGAQQDRSAFRGA